LVAQRERGGRDRGESEGGSGEERVKAEFRSMGEIVVDLESRRICVSFE